VLVGSWRIWSTCSRLVVLVGDMVTDHYLCKLNFAIVALSSVVVWFFYVVLSAIVDV
jgi:hypothetical protein